MEELLPPIEPDPTLWRKHRRGLLIAVGVVVALVVTTIVLYATQDPDVTQAGVGDCLAGEVAFDSTFRSGEIVDCSKPHTREVYAVGSTDKEISLLDEPLDPELVRIRSEERRVGKECRL